MMTGLAATPRRTLTSSARATLKRSHNLHAAYKLAKRFNEVPLTSWLRPRRTYAIFRVLPNTMLSAPRLINAYEAAETVEREQVDGAIVECGVWAGGAVGLMASASKQHGNTRRMFHLFDSFEGLPQPSEHDVDVLAPFRSQHPDLELDDGTDQRELQGIGACAAPLMEVYRLFFGVLGIDPHHVVIHEGWFQDTVPKAARTLGPIAVLRIDGDWYESTKVCLEHLYDHVVDDGFIIFDDYGTFSGCRKAVDEFFTARQLSPELTGIDGEGVYFRRRDEGTRN